MLMQDQILVIPSLLTSQECDQYIEFFNQNEKSHYYESSVNVLTNRVEPSTFKTVEIKPGTNYYNQAFQKIELGLKKWLDHLEEFNSFHVSGLKKNLNYPHQIRILKYDTGDSIHPHTDYQDFSFASCTLNLNDDYTGGEFSFFNKKISIKLNKGDALIFPNNFFWVHEVLKITSGSRYSINSFILSMPYDKKLALEERILFFKKLGNKFSLNGIDE